MGAWRAPPGRLPYFEHAPDADQLVQTIYDSGIMYNFDWPAWQRHAERLFRDPAALRRARLSTLRKLLITHVRKDRFVEGHLAAMLVSGHMAAILRRVAELRSGL